MSGLDAFLGTSKPKPENRCANPKCRKVLTTKDTTYTLTRKGKTETYCQPCAKLILKPQEEAKTL